MIFTPELRRLPACWAWLPGKAATGLDIRALADLDARRSVLRGYARGYVLVRDAGAVSGAQLPLSISRRPVDLLGHRDGEPGARLVYPGRDRLGAGADPVLGAALSRHLAGAGLRHDR